MQLIMQKLPAVKLNSWITLQQILPGLTARNGILLSSVTVTRERMGKSAFTSRLPRQP